MDLQVTSGLPLQADGDGRLIFGAGLTVVTPAVRTREEMREVLLDPEADAPAELYYMYRDVCRQQDRELLAQHGLRYDVTVIRPGLLGRDYIKTAGHYHPLKPGTEVTYPEVYEVLAGKAHYLLQTEPDEDGVEAILIEATAGDKVLIPPGYGHITINPASEFLIMSNWVAAIYFRLAPSNKTIGGAYFEADWWMRRVSLSLTPAISPHRAQHAPAEERRIWFNPRTSHVPGFRARRSLLF